MESAFLGQQLYEDSIARSVPNLKKLGKRGLTSAKIQSRILSLNDAWRNFQDGHIALCRLVPLEERESYAYFKENRYLLVEESLQTSLDYMREELLSLDPTSSHVSRQEIANFNMAPSATSAPLPTIHIKPFDGKPSEWESFRDRFTAIVHLNQSLSDVAKMHYLVSSLSGCALNCIQTLTVTADHYSIAWKTLVARFENPHRLLAIYLNSLLTIPAVSRENSADIQALRDKTNLVKASLLKLNRQPADLWDDLLAHLIAERLDPASRKAWKTQLNDKEFPSFDQLDEFLLSRVRVLEEYSEPSKCPARFAAHPHVTVATATPSSVNVCPLCKGNHFINSCSRFLRHNSTDRRELVRRHKRCVNCLSDNHVLADCKSKYSCRTCHKRHHSLLHPQADHIASQSFTASSSDPPTDDELNIQSLHANQISRGLPNVLLATAWITVGVPNGRTVVVRALIDQGSAMTLITENVAQMLRVSRQRMPISVTAVGGVNIGTPQHAAHIFVSSQYSLTPSFHVKAPILKTLTTYAPSTIHTFHASSLFHKLPLADPDPTSSSPIDIIIGADLYSSILQNGVRKSKHGHLLAQKTIFGWILSGPRDPFNQSDLPSQNPTRISISSYHCSIKSYLHTDLQQFWSLEEIPSTTFLKPEELQCEEHFKTTHYRDSSGRYTVRLPFKDSPPINIGLSRPTAVQRLSAIHRRFKTNDSMRMEYTKFLNEYERLNHMVAVPSPSPLSNQIVYIPHHPVVRDDSLTSHLRVVFNASSLTSNGTSLNSLLLTGPKLQSDISAVILRWRQWQFVYSADIAKMYCQIKIDPRDVDYQRTSGKLAHPAQSLNFNF